MKKALPESVGGTHWGSDRGIEARKYLLILVLYHISIYAHIFLWFVFYLTKQQMLCMKSFQNFAPSRQRIYTDSMCHVY
jgi:hypothetical protein